MIISFSKRFLFIHVPKTAGESLRELLLIPANGGAQFMRKHSTFMDAKAVMAGYLEQFRVFAVVRNPFEQVVSFYEHLRKPLQMGAGEIELQWPGSNGRLTPHWASQLAMQTDFREYVKRAYDAPEGPAHLMRDQCAWLVDVSGSLGRVTVLRFEKLVQDLSVLSQQLELQGSLPWRNESRARIFRGQYREYYDDSSRAIISRHFATTLERFGYEF
jgi:hypothetical protein